MNLIFTWKNLIVMDGTTELIRYPSTCKVRHELNRLRKRDQVLYTVNRKPKPYYPRQFPSGIYLITAVEWTKKGSERFDQYGPVIIKTNATREIFTWDLDAEGNYGKPTGKTQTDTCYYIHHTHRYTTTHGCIRGGESVSQMEHMGRIVEKAMKKGQKNYLEVL